MIYFKQMEWENSDVHSPSLPVLRQRQSSPSRIGLDRKSRETTPSRELGGMFGGLKLGKSELFNFRIIVHFKYFDRFFQVNRQLLAVAHSVLCLFIRVCEVLIQLLREILSRLVMRWFLINFKLYKTFIYFRTNLIILVSLQYLNRHPISGQCLLYWEVASQMMIWVCGRSDQIYD